MTFAWFCKDIDDTTLFESNLNDEPLIYVPQVNDTFDPPVENVSVESTLGMSSTRHAGLLLLSPQYLDFYRLILCTYLIISHYLTLPFLITSLNHLFLIQRNIIKTNDKKTIRNQSSTMCKQLFNVRFIIVSLFKAVCLITITTVQLCILLLKL